MGFRNSWILGGDKAVILQSCFLDVLPRHTNITADKVFDLLDECAARCAHLFSKEEECTSSSCGQGTVENLRMWQDS